MPAPIPEVIKSKVMDMWPLGYSRDYIASANHISTGAVSNIVKEWEDRIGKDVMRGLREIGVLLKKESLSPAQCAIGFRIMKIIAGEGVDAETAEHFISDTYKECYRLGFTPGNIVAHIEDLTKFSKEENVRPPEIEVYVDKKKAQKEELEDEVEELNNAVAILEEKKSELVKSCEIILEQKRGVEHEMQSYHVSKQGLEKLGISMTNDIPKFAGTVKTIANYGYDPQRILEEFFDIQYHQDKQRALKIIIAEDQKYLEWLNHQKSSVLRSISLHSDKAEIYNELANAGFGIKEQKRLLDTIMNIATSNQISYWIAIDKFFNDIQTQYDAKLGFEAAKDNLVKEIKGLEEEREEKLQNLKNQLFVGPIIARLISVGLSENDILESGMTFLNIWKSSSSLRDIALSMINAVEATMSRRTRTTADNKTIGILKRTREELSRIDLSR